MKKVISIILIVAVLFALVAAIILNGFLDDWEVIHVTATKGATYRSVATKYGVSKKDFYYWVDWVSLHNSYPFEEGDDIIIIVPRK